MTEGEQPTGIKTPPKGPGFEPLIGSSYTPFEDSITTQIFMILRNVFARFLMIFFMIIKLVS